jgi:hypothetical protein
MYLVCDRASGAQTCTYENEHDDLIEGFMSLAWIQVLATQVVCAVEVKAKIQDCACTSVALVLSITLSARRACASSMSIPLFSASYFLLFGLPQTPRGYEMLMFVF